MPWERKEYLRTPSVLTPEVQAFIAACLKTDEEEGTAKQHHTAKRIYDRLVDEMGFTGGESTIRGYVSEMKGRTKEAFVPLAFAAGDAVQVDWGEATIVLGGVKKVVNLFCARLCYSAAPFVAAYRRQNSESFLDALVQTFSYFGGTPRRVIFDNAKVAVKDGFGANARATDSYAALSAHYGFEPVFCNIASGNEKGLVEGLVGFSRRNFCVPLPRVESMEEMNVLLRERCEKYLDHTIQGKSADVGTLFREEQKKLYSLPVSGYDPAKRADARVSRSSTVRYDTNNYSVPVQFCGKSAAIKALPERIEIFHGGNLIAVHQRCFGRYESCYQLEHYLPLLARKGRAIFQAKPVLDHVPEYFLDWLKRQDLHPSELIAILTRSLEIGFDAVMSDPVPLRSAAAPEIHDPVSVNSVDLTAYDALCGQRKGVNT